MFTASPHSTKVGPLPRHGTSRTTIQTLNSTQCMTYSKYRYDKLHCFRLRNSSILNIRFTGKIKTNFLAEYCCDLFFFDHRFNSQISFQINQPVLWYQSHICASLALPTPMFDTLVQQSSTTNCLFPRTLAKHAHTSIH